MKKRMLSMLVVLVLVCLSYNVPYVSAYDIGKAGQYRTIATGGHTAVIKADGSLWAWGDNSYGQICELPFEKLYLNLPDYRLEPVKIMDNVAGVSVGYGYTAAIKKDGGLWVRGKNWGGKVSDGTTQDIYGFVKIMDDVAGISADINHIAAIKNDGSLWIYGRNDNSTGDKTLPVKIMDDVAIVSTGGGCTAAIKTDGSLWTWGSNIYGQLGDGTTEYRHSPVKIMDDVAILSGNTAAIKTDGSLWMWGRNGNGRLGDGTTEDRHSPVKIMDDVASVLNPGSGTVAMKTDGSLWTWGSNMSWELGDGTEDREFYRVSPEKIMDNVDGVSLGYGYAVVIKKDGSLWTWGSNIYGYFGEGATEGRYSPVKIMDGVAVPNKPVQNDKISVLLNGNEIIFDKPPVMLNDRVLVPIRAIFEALGYTVDWDVDTETATALKGDNRITVQLNNGKINYNIDGVSGEYTCDVPPRMISDRILVPVRAIAESADCIVEWDNADQSVIITKNN